MNEEREKDEERKKKKEREREQKLGTTAYRNPLVSLTPKTQESANVAQRTRAFFETVQKL